MKVFETAIADVKIIEPVVHGDDRGCFFESFQQARYQALLNIQDAFVQDNVSCSARDVLRGLHFQTQHPQGKLVTVLAGEILDVAVDVRRDSPTFGRHVTVTLSEHNRRQLWMPKGFAHGFLVVSEKAIVTYKATAAYHPASERSLLWQDDVLAIDWPLQGRTPQLSEKDVRGVCLARFPVSDLPVYAPSDSLDVAA